MHMDMGQNQQQTSRLFSSNGCPESLYIPNLMDRDNENGAASKIISWKYPRENIDGNGWHWDNDTLETNMIYKAGRADGGLPTMKWDDKEYLNMMGDVHPRPERWRRPEERLATVSEHSFQQHPPPNRGW